METQVYRKTSIQENKGNTEGQEQKDTGTQGYRDKGTQGYRNTRI